MRTGTERWIIEARKPDGSLDLSGRQPHEVFGKGAIHGMTDHAIAQVIYKHNEAAVLRGDQIAQWPALIDPRWCAREKTW